MENIATQDDKGNIPVNTSIAGDEYKTSAMMWQWYQDSLDGGHKDWIQKARKNERYYLGGGGQWSEEDREYLETVAKTLPVEINAILPAINTVIGEQIFTRVDISFRPKKEPANQQTAEILRKLVLHIKDNVHLPNAETQVFSDGIIQQRGYYDVRMEFTENMQGEIEIEAVDPLDIIPDPNAQSYDPKEWQRFQRTRWLSYDEIEGLYGTQARKKVESTKVSESNWGSDATSADDSEGRNAFGNVTAVNKYYDAYIETSGIKKVRVLETQWRKFKQEMYFVTPEGDTRIMPDDITQEQLQAYSQIEYQVITRLAKKIRWTVSTLDAVIYDDWSPYADFTIIPFFPIFRRGKTLGLVDNTISSQDVLNGSVTAMLQITKSTSNAGWQVEEESLIKPESAEDLEDVGRKTGLVIVYKKGSTPPEKTQPNSIPTGIDRLLQYGEKFTKDTIGVSEAEQGQKSQEVSGVAIQTKVFQGKMQRGIVMDNLALTRLLLAQKILKLIQQYYTETRIFKIAGRNPIGQPAEETVAINQGTPEGQIINDVTLGEYEVVIDAIPTSASFEAQSFQQAVELRGVGVPIPDAELIRYANFTNKAEIIQALSQPKPDPVMEMKLKEVDTKVAKMMAEIENLNAQTEKFLSEATTKQVDAQLKSAQTAELITRNPNIAPATDELLESAGYIDHNKPTDKTNQTKMSQNVSHETMPPEEQMPPEVNYPPPEMEGMEGIQ